MNLPYSWLQTFIQDLPPVAKTADLLASIGLGVERTFVLPTTPDGVITARVESVTAIETSDHLTACVVSDGTNNYNVVCGAPNVKPGLITALAKSGVTLPELNLTIEKRTLQGAESNGMLCSPKELGLYEYGGGIIEFSTDTPVGKNLNELWPEEHVIELELTPNRADAFSVLGVARDLAAKLGVAFTHPAANVPLSDPAFEDGLRVTVEDTVACPRFTLQRIDDVRIEPSPIWLQRRLASVGLRPRNNVVDVTNFVTFELGQPSHAYDLDNLRDNTIVVRHAKNGEQLTVLNEDELTFTPDDLLITMPDGNGGTQPIGVAGVIGGLHDSVTPTTTSVALEAAHFNPVVIRKAAKRLGQFTDAHYRFERGVDPNLPPVASARAAQLIAEIAGGSVHAGITSVGADVTTTPVTFRPSRVEFLTTITVPADTQQRYLEALGCTVEKRAEDDWRITPPSWRYDMSIEEDFVEEIARLHGYDHIADSIPAMNFIPPLTDATHQKLKGLLVGLGLQETINYIFTSDDELTRAAAPASSVQLLSPQGAERSVLRTAVYPSLLAAAQTNHAVPSLALFEIGHVFNEQETERLSILIRGPWVQSNWQKTQPLEFFAFKGVLEKLARSLNIDFTVIPEAHAALHPGISATVLLNGKPHGFMGKLHPQIASHYDLKDAFIAELTLPLPESSIVFEDYARQPYAERDLAIIAPTSVTYAELVKLTQPEAGEKLESVDAFDVYEGAPIPEGNRSIALRFRFRDTERALQDNEVDAYMANVISAVQKAGYAIRDK